MTPILLTASAKHDEALSFYRDVMGFTLIDDSPFSLEFDTAGTMLRVQKVESFAPHPFNAVGWRVDDIAAERDRLARRGAELNSSGLNSWNRTSVPSGLRRAVPEFAGSRIPMATRSR